MNNADTYLHRNILPGKQYEKLIPKSVCAKVNGGIGYTDHSIEKMVEVVETYSWQMQEVAALLHKSSLETTANAVFDFIFNHFQYKADLKDQLLRSPACSWHDRYNGIDCKSYSILASSLLCEMGINHYIRKIKQPYSDAPNEYTHVYVIVPKDQKSNDLNKGYYVIDGTVRDNYEPDFTEPKDEFMNGLQHYVLNGPALNASTGTTDYGAIIGDVIKNIDFSKWGNLFNFKCPGASSYPQDKFNSDSTSIGNYCTKTLNEINAALANNNMTVFSEKVTEYLGMTAVLTKTVYAKSLEKWVKNQCTRDNMNEMVKVCQYYEMAVGDALDTWLSKNFKSTQSGTRTFTTANLMAKGIAPWAGYVEPYQTITAPFEVFSRLSPLPIVGFEITPYLASVSKTPTSFDANKYLNELATIYKNVVPNNTTNTTDPNAPNYTPTTTTGTSMASAGVVLGIVALGIAFGAKKFANQPNKN